MHNFIEKIFGWCYPFLLKIGFNDTLASYSSLLINIILLGLLAYGIYIIFRLILVTVLVVIAKRTKTNFDDLLVNNQTAKYIAHLIPFLFIYKSVPIIMEDFVSWEWFFAKIVGVYIVLFSLWISRSFLNAFRDFLKSKQRFSDKPIDSYVQVIMIVLWMFGVFVIIYEIFDIEKKLFLVH